MTTMLLNASELRYQYGTQTVFSDVNLQIDKDTLAVLIGRNGSGKSTLLRCLAGWTMPEAGEIVINDLSLREDEDDFRKQVIFVPDTPDFYDELTAWEHLQFVAQLHRIPDWETQSETLLENLYLVEQANAFPFTFSRGMRYKLALAMALLIHPPLLLLDEPFGPLDSVSSNFLWETMETYCQHGHSILFSSHVLQKNHKPDKFILLQHGELQDISGDDVESIGVLLDEG